MIVHRLVAFLVAVSCLAACNEQPACERLVVRLCAAGGESACTQLKAHAPTDQASCAAALDDVQTLEAQLTALVAADAARALAPKEPPAASKD